MKRIAPHTVYGFHESWCYAFLRQVIRPLDPPKVSDQDIETFLGNNSGLVGIDLNRMSRLLCEQLAFGIKTRTLDLFGVTDVLQTLEGHRTHGHVEVRQFNHPLQSPKLSAKLQSE